MQLLAFRITNFRSIIDSPWIPFSPDGITVFVGQNESGKTSVLDALYFALAYDQPTSDDFRIGAALPEVFLRIGVESSDVDARLDSLPAKGKGVLKEYLSKNANKVEIKCHWGYEHIEGKDKLISYTSTVDEVLENLLGEAAAASPATDAPGSAPPQAATATTVIVTVPASGTPDVQPPSPQQAVPDEDVGLLLWRALPLAVLFNEESGRLPNQVDIDDKGQPTGVGAKAAQNFLQIAEINLPDLLKGDRRARENTLNRANARVSQDFNSFWSQTIGKSGKLSLKCDIDHYSSSPPEKAGKPHLVFWICDGNTQLYPKQRSQGVRWFVSFYLQLKASEKNRDRRVFLLDEPGANLHSKAQGDVLKLINKLGKDTSTVVYTTHSPQMVEYPRLFRVHAVQRDGDLDDAPTRIIDAHQLGTASTDTLSPILTAMGADLSQHQVVRKTNNVLLEEMSGYYYISSFWHLTGTQQEAHFIAATGVNKIEALANMFRGWGLGFIVAVDDDKQGREAFKAMKRELFGDDDEVAKQFLLKLPGCVGIEDVFQKEDFCKYVLGDPAAKVEKSNAEYMKDNGRSKPVAAFRFALAITEGKLAWKDLSRETQDKITAVVDEIRKRLPVGG